MMRRRGRGPGWALIGLVLLLSACNSDRPEPAEFDLPSAGLRLNLTRLATHPFLSRYRLTLRIEGPRGCSATAELFPDTGYAGRRNVYQQPSGLITVLGQYDARVFDPANCSLRLVEFQSLVGQATFLGAFDVDAQKRWRFLDASVRPERSFEKQ
ncbi:conserved exported protein of unknown function [Nitrospira defluvii]|jgi:hypothetical protein|uniref:Lipoprotein n=1 Tax=Nitrospira defluvii TaxID=330214 RepID=D8PCD7_9BACT|nr:conserved exported protein of unknown function [Nitrospira defluvii]